MRPSHTATPDSLLACSRGATRAWLVNGLGCSLADVVMVERNDEMLQHFRECGQEWRVKPLAWSEAGIRAAVSQSRKRIASALTYYHSVKGVHFLSWPEFHRLAGLAR